MKQSKLKRIIAIVISMCILLQMLPGFGMKSVRAEGAFDMILYVGGTGASDSNNGSKSTPFATLWGAINTINSMTNNGNYKIIVQGNTNENNWYPALSEGKKLTIVGPEDSNKTATVNRKMASVGFSFDTDLTLGDPTGASGRLIFDGNNLNSSYQMIRVNAKRKVDVYNVTFTKFKCNSIIDCFTGGELHLDGEDLVDNNAKAIGNQGTITIKGTTFRNNVYGDTACIINGGIATISDSKFENNNSSGGMKSAIYNCNKATLNLYGSIGMKDNLSYDIFSQGTINIGDKLTVGNKIKLLMYNSSYYLYYKSIPVLNGTEDNIKTAYEDFELNEADPKINVSDYSINSKGMLIYDPGFVSVNSTTVKEGDGKATFVISLSKALNVPVDITYK
jgi:hypothetical protein